MLAKGIAKKEQSDMEKLREWNYMVRVSGFKPEEVKVELDKRSNDSIYLSVVSFSKGNGYIKSEELHTLLPSNLDVDSLKVEYVDEQLFFNAKYLEKKEEIKKEEPVQLSIKKNF